MRLEIKAASLLTRVPRTSSGNIKALADTALLREVETFELGNDFLALGFIFTLKFDSDGNWKIIKTQSMSKEEAMNE